MLCLIWPIWLYHVNCMTRIPRYFKVLEQSSSFQQPATAKILHWVKYFQKLRNSQNAKYQPIKLLYFYRNSAKSGNLIEPFDSPSKLPNQRQKHKMPTLLLGFLVIQFFYIWATSENLAFWRFDNFWKYPLHINQLARHIHYSRRRGTFGTLLSVETMNYDWFESECHWYKQRAQSSRQ